VHCLTSSLHDWVVAENCTILSMPLATVGQPMVAKMENLNPDFKTSLRFSWFGRVAQHGRVSEGCKAGLRRAQDHLLVVGSRPQQRVLTKHSSLGWTCGLCSALEQTVLHVATNVPFGCHLFVHHSSGADIRARLAVSSASLPNCNLHCALHIDGLRACSPTCKITAQPCAPCRPCLAIGR
jgi:hypothetical protein